jgi:hypothetical protein
MMSCLFGRLPAHPTLVKRHAGSHIVSNRETLFAGTHGDQALATLRAYNQHTRDLFISHLRQFIASTPEDPALSQFNLPLTSASLPKAAPASVVPGSGVLSYLKSNSRTVGLRSPFVALRGFGDSFSTVNELARDARGDVFVCSSQVRSTCRVDVLWFCYPAKFGATVCSRNFTDCVRRDVSSRCPPLTSATCG